ncbi:hypothetical protein [Mycoplasmopsis arginini]|uniref:hypothetical protein n=1 Tax=Mycoplasmopsis arginini TaxID=2094 RepID=UPI003CFF6A2A
MLSLIFCFASLTKLASTSLTSLAILLPTILAFSNIFAKAGVKYSSFNFVGNDTFLFSLYSRFAKSSLLLSSSAILFSNSLDWFSNPWTSFSKLSK